VQDASKDEPISMLPHSAKQEDVNDPESGSNDTRPGVVSWSPPLPNWNPWSSCNIDEGPLATVC